MFSCVVVKVEFLSSWFSFPEFACTEFLRQKSTLNKISYRLFTWLETFETIKALYLRVHIERENIIRKQRFEWSKIMKKAFEWYWSLWYWMLIYKSSLCFLSSSAFFIWLYLALYIYIYMWRKNSFVYDFKFHAFAIFRYTTYVLILSQWLFNTFAGVCCCYLSFVLFCFVFFSGYFTKYLHNWSSRV